MSAAPVGSASGQWTEGLLTPDELEQYWQDGYVIKRGVFQPEELQPVIEEVNRCGRPGLTVMGKVPARPCHIRPCPALLHSQQGVDAPPCQMAPSRPAQAWHYPADLHPPPPRRHTSAGTPVLWAPPPPCPCGWALLAPAGRWMSWRTVCWLLGRSQTCAREQTFTPDSPSWSSSLSTPGGCCSLGACQVGAAAGVHARWVCSWGMQGGRRQLEQQSEHAWWVLA